MDTAINISHRYKGRDTTRGKNLEAAQILLRQSTELLCSKVGRRVKSAAVYAKASSVAFSQQTHAQVTNEDGSSLLPCT